VSAYWQFLLQRLTATRFARHVTEALFRARGRHLLAGWDETAPHRSQARLLLGLVHRAQATRFGFDHDFRRVRTVEDFQRLVPVRTRSELWRTYWQAAFPQLEDVTWPGPVPPPALLKAPGESVAAPLCLTPDLLAANRAALRTALALAADVRPRQRLLDGQALLLGDAVLPLPGSDELAVQGVPAELRAYADAGIGWNWGERLPATSLADLAAAYRRGRVTCLAGPAGRIARFLQCVRDQSGEDSIGKVWPDLAIVLSVRPGWEASPVDLRAFLDEKVLVLDVAAQPEGMIAVTDPRHGGLRLLSDHGLFFEFVPAAEVDQPSPPRHTLARVETGVPYEMVLTSPAGLWACRVGCAVSFQRRDVPLLRFVEPLPLPVARPEPVAPVRGDLMPASARPPHRRSGGIPAVLPETFVRSPWSAPADRE
jgi:hypothetical protein